MRSHRLLAATVVALLAACAGGAARTSAEAPVALPHIDHVVLIVLENRSAPQILRSPAAGTFRSLAQHYVVLDRYYAVAHPSLPNYLALIAGSTFGVRRDCLACRIDAPSLATTLAATGRSWKVYVEDPATLDVRSRRRYERVRIPFLYFDGLSRQQLRRSVVPFSRLHRDLARKALPDFSLVVPSLCDSMHNCSIATGDRWLRRTTHELLASPGLGRGVVFVVFDEGRHRDRAGGGGHVLALALGPLVRHDDTSLQVLDHYSLLRTIEDAWQLPYLGQSASAAPITGIWQTGADE